MEFTSHDPPPSVLLKDQVAASFQAFHNIKKKYISST